MSRIEDLSDEELNLKICKWMGWKLVPRQPYWREDEVRWTLDGTTQPTTSGLPNHITGIEALGNMALAEARLTNDEHALFRDILWKQVFQEAMQSPHWPERLYQARTARQRAIALVKTVEEKP